MKLPLASKSVTRSITITIIWVADSMIVLACFPWKFSADHTRLASMVSETVDFRSLHLDARQASHQIYINSAWQNRRSLRNGTQRLRGYTLCFWGSQRSLKAGQQTDLGSHLYPQDPCMDYGTFIYVSWVFIVNVGQYASFMATTIWVGVFQFIFVHHLPKSHRSRARLSPGRQACEILGMTNSGTIS